MFDKKPRTEIIIISFLFGVFLTIYIKENLRFQKNEIKEHFLAYQYPKGKHKYILVIIVISKYNHYYKRRVIRETWYPSNSNIATIFVVGGHGHRRYDDNYLKWESFSYHDLLVVPCEEHFFNLTRKVMYALLYVQKNYDFDYVMKCDDDTYVNVHPFMNALSHFKDEYLYWGYYEGGAIVLDHGRHEEKKWFICDNYLPYAAGGGYVFGKGIVKYITDNHYIFSMYNNEDASFGLWTAPLNISRVHENRFDTLTGSRGCLNDFLVLHKSSSIKMYQHHENFLKTSNICDKEYLKYEGHTYNWNTIPSRCCHNIRIPPMYCVTRV